MSATCCIKPFVRFAFSFYNSFFLGWGSRILFVLDNECVCVTPGFFTFWFICACRLCARQWIQHVWIIDCEWKKAEIDQAVKALVSRGQSFQSPSAGTHGGSQLCVWNSFSFCHVSNSTYMWDIVRNDTCKSAPYVWWAMDQATRIWFVALMLAFYSLTMTSRADLESSSVGAQVNGWHKKLATVLHICSSKVKNVWRFICMPSTCLCGTVHRQRHSCTSEETQYQHWCWKSNPGWLTHSPSHAGWL
jgi:hypothetical protein